MVSRYTTLNQQLKTIQCSNLEEMLTYVRNSLTALYSGFAGGPHRPIVSWTVLTCLRLPKFPLTPIGIEHEAEFVDEKCGICGYASVCCCVK